MAARRRILTFLFLAAISFSIACGGGSSSSSSHTTQASVSIALNPAPTSSSVPVGSTTGIQFTPVVSNDPNSAGVDWAITCPLNTPASPNPGACGTLSISNFHSASGTAVSYIPPAFIPDGSLTVNVTVFATADHTQNVTTPVTVTTYVSVLSGTYILQVNGSDSTPNPYQGTGVFVFDGQGNITSGEQTINSSSNGFFSSSFAVQGSTGTPSTYFIGPDGRGVLTLNVQQSSNAGNTIQENFSLVVLSKSEALIAELEPNTSGISAYGTLELQDSTAAATMPTGAYAFVTNGSDAGGSAGPGGGSPVPTAFGGVFNIDNNTSTGSISGNGSLADQDYYNSKGNRTFLSCAPPVGVNGSVSQPAAMGIVTITLTGASCFSVAPPGSIQFTGYIVDSTHIRLIESDDVDGSSGFLTAGIAVSQGPAAGTFTNASLSGPYVFGVLGHDLNASSPSSFTSAGVIDADGSGHLSGINDTFFPGDSAAFTANQLTGIYAVDANFIGRADLTPKFKGSPKPKPTLLFYLTGNGTPPLVLWAGGKDNNFPAIGTGIAYPQAANPSTFTFGNPETYGVRFTQSNGAENDGSGRVTSTINGIAGALSGLVDDFNNNGLNGGAGPFTIIDTFTLPADNFGRFSGTFTDSPGSSGPFVEYYL
ncbi:MAG TPA: hypothetical protein VI756_16720, partial [Blastocatellia bacterium]